jgi:DNA-binding transcriptional MerR regulator
MMVSTGRADRQRLLTVGQAAKVLGCCAETLRRYDRKGTFRAHRAPPPFDHRRLYREEDILRLRSLLHGEETTG